MAKKKFQYSANVKRLAQVSFYTDLASEMLYPIMPLLWTSLGFSAQMIGIIEGLAEAVAGLSKLLWGYIADRFRNYRKLVIIGYGISAAMKPLFGITTTFVVPLLARNVERLGKAIRTAPRDAILAAESTPDTRARIIGYHRAMDTLGAVAGPAVCLVLLLVLQGNLQAIFLIAIIPGLLAVLVALKVDDKNAKKQAAAAVAKTHTRAPLKDLKKLKDYRLLIVGLFLFAVINSSDAFLILRLHEMGLDAVMIVLAYMLYNTVYAASAKSAHHIVGRFNMRSSLLLAMAVFALVYWLLSFDLHFAGIVVILMMYGLFAGLFEVTSKSWLANLLPGSAKATGLGLAGSVTSLGFLFACLITGLLWSKIGSASTLALLAVSCVVPILYFSVISIKERYE